MLRRYNDSTSCQMIFQANESRACGLSLLAVYKRLKKTQQVIKTFWKEAELKTVQANFARGVLTLKRTNKLLPFRRWAGPVFQLVECTLGSYFNGYISFRPNELR